MQRPLPTKRLCILGAGNMGEALLRGLLKAGAITADRVVCTGRRPERLAYLEKTYKVTVTSDNVAAARGADLVLLAIKPQIMARVLKDVGPVIGTNALVVSIAAGVSTATIESQLAAGVHVVRSMPNTPCLVDAGATAIAPGTHATADDVALARTLFEAVGSVTEVEETLLDAVTGLSGSGPAYVFMIVEALADAGVKVGLPRYQSQALAAQTVLGAAKLLLETGEHPGVLKDRVTSPGGTAIVGLHTLEQGGLRTTLINAVVAATERSRELGSGGKK
jgi:pyrroline-5-carboxylate reductase